MTTSTTHESFRDVYISKCSPRVSVSWWFLCRDEPCLAIVTSRSAAQLATPSGAAQPDGDDATASRSAAQLATTSGVAQPSLADQASGVAQPASGIAQPTSGVA